MNIRQVLAEGRRIFLAGLATAFPWILAAELFPLIPPFSSNGSLASDDFPGVVVCGVLQAFLYGMAILRLPLLAGETSRKPWRQALRATPWVFIAYLVYELLVGAGLIVALLFFVLGYLSLGLTGALLLCLLSLIPTVIVSTAFALFVYPAVLEGRGPFAALGESWRLVLRRWARTSVVISVPALALLVEWFAQNWWSLYRAFQELPEMLSQLSSLSTDISGMQLQSLLGSFAADTTPALVWRLLLAAVAALVWWYTLAVCYAEYRELAGSKPA